MEGVFSEIFSSPIIVTPSAIVSHHERDLSTRLLLIRASSAFASQRPVLGRPRMHYSPGRIQSYLNWIFDTQARKSIAHMETAVPH
jgi:hypothetical protein